MKKSQFKRDERKTNPSLHLLYVEWALQHLTMIERCLDDLNSFSNLNMMDVAFALVKARDKLIKENAAYADAWKFYQSILKIQARQVE
jgi:hypothetical protein